MKSSCFYFSTLKEVPNEADLPSHQLMIKAGLIRKIASGLYVWMPIGLRILKKVEAIIRDEMNKAGAIELLMPTIQPSELWKHSGRWEKYGKELLRITDRNEREFCYGPTHEEVITYIVKQEINSYKQLPLNFYQIQNKFRDEIRPRFGVMRSREFIMKDAYSFHENKDSLKETYQKMYQAYKNIFTRLGLNFRAVVADNGSIGGSSSHEFQVIAQNGEDIIVYSTESDYAANIELAPSIRQKNIRNTASQDLNLIYTPGVKTIDEVVKFLQVDTKQIIKSILVEGQAENEVILLLLRGDHELNEIKASKLQGVKVPLTFVCSENLTDELGIHGGCLGPIGFKGKIYADFSLEVGSDWVIGANKDDYHYTGFNFKRDLPEPEFVDLRNVIEGDPSPDGKGVLKMVKGIEVGHIFELGNQYSKAMNATFLDKEGKTQFFEMGCYGIGITRVIAAAIEQNHDKKGIIWTKALCPFDVILVPINYHKSENVRHFSENLDHQLSEKGIDVLLDDRDERAGVLLHDSELLGIPHRVVIGDRGLAAGIVEYQTRRQQDLFNVPTEEIVHFLFNLIK